MIPPWLHTLATASLLLAAFCAVWIAADLANGHRQHMAVMNVVWPITALYAGPLALIAYFTVGRRSTRAVVEQAKARGEKPPGKVKPFWQKVALGASHCGAGCTLADIIGEWALFAFPLTLFGMKIFGAWAVDYVLALLIGILFQYYAIAPMRDLSLGEGLKAAIKADVLSLTAWQVGMYGWMAIATFGIFGHELHQTEPTFWFMMQIAHVGGLRHELSGELVAHPVGDQGGDVSRSGADLARSSGPVVEERHVVRREDRANLSGVPCERPLHLEP